LLGDQSVFDELANLHASFSSKGGEGFHQRILKIITTSHSFSQIIAHLCETLHWSILVRPTTSRKSTIRGLELFDSHAFCEISRAIDLATT